MTDDPSASSIPTSNSVPNERTGTSEANQNDAPNGETASAETRLNRRSYLTLLGISTLPLAATRAQAAETGYGEGGYGEGGYGGGEDGTDDPVAPSVVTDSATDITDSSATLQGTVTDLGSADAVDGYFEFREVDSSDWSTTETRQLTANGSYSVRIEDLDSDTNYEYRALAASDDGTDTGETLSFVTDAAEVNEPVVESLSGRDTSPPNPHVDLEVDWHVSHPDGALDEVELFIRNDNDRLIDGSTIAVSGSSASGSEMFSIKHGAGESYVVTLAVSDRADNIVRENVTIET